MTNDIITISALSGSERYTSYEHDTSSIHGRLKWTEVEWPVVNNCLAVAEMGDRLATIDMGRKLVGPCSFWGSWVPI